METTSNSARQNSDVREALKRQQHARLAVKTRVAAGEIEAHEYSNLYASQPAEVAAAKAAAQNTAARQAAKSAAYAGAISDAEGAESVFAGGTV